VYRAFLSCVPSSCVPSSYAPSSCVPSASVPSSCVPSASVPSTRYWFMVLGCVLIQHILYKAETFGFDFRKTQHVPRSYPISIHRLSFHVHRSLFICIGLFSRAPWKETYAYEKRPMNMKRDLWTWKETLWICVGKQLANSTTLSILNWWDTNSRTNYSEPPYVKTKITLYYGVDTISRLLQIIGFFCRI